MDLAQYALNNAPLDLSRFTTIKDREFRPGYDLTALKYLRLQAGRERDLRELYRGRAPYELLQNADDAKAIIVVFIVSEDGLALAHDGNWFTVANFRSLADGWSDKDPNECIGHKGLGFRSVLDLTPSPHLLSLNGKEFFAIKFAWALNNGHFHEAFKHDSSLRTHYANWTRNGQLVCPVMSIPGLAKKQGLGSGAAIYDKLIKGYYGNHSTLFWLPVSDPDIPKSTLDELGPIPISEDALRSFLTDEVSTLLPFLKSVEKVLLFKGQERITSVILKGSRTGGIVSVTTEDEGNKYTKSFFQKRFSFSIPPNVSVDPQTPKAVKAMKNADITLSVRLADNQPVGDEDSPFHVYFPTEEQTGLGFIIHGDFYVKPDRTRLMDATYNTWLLKAAAQKAANEFLSEMIEQYDAEAVFGSLSPSGQQSDAADVFVDAFSLALSKRRTAYIPSNAGLLTSEEAVLPPSLDPDGFWDSHFSDIAGLVIEGKKGFVLPAIDDEATREFFALAKVEILTSEKLLDLIEAASEESKPMAWWYQCYGFLSQESNLALKDHTYFSGRKLIPLTDKSIISVSENRDLVVCLPPRGDTANLQVPECFSSSFVLVNSGLARLLHTGKDSVRSWILDRLQIARFEASELLPRAIRSVAPKLYDGRITLGTDELQDLWSFVFRVNQLSRAPIEAAEFWQDIGRLPLPMETTRRRNTANGNEFAPASLLYWANGDRDGCLAGVKGLRRVANSFIDELVKSSKIPKNDWIGFFSKAGISNSPQFRTYSRVVASEGETPLNGSLTIDAGPYSGERQRDQNRAALTCLTSEAWAEIVGNAPACGHNSRRALQSLGVVEGLDEAVQAAQSEYEAGNEHWQERLWSLIRTLPPQAFDESRNDSAFCYGGRGGHAITIGRYIDRQLDKRLLPSSQGPATRNDCFVRQASRRIISTGISGDEIGDTLLPYVVVKDFREAERLRQLGVDSLDDVASASTEGLIRALFVLGERLSTDWGQKEILSERARWRLVRGAIQDIYRTLNQRFSNESTTDTWFPPETKFGARTSDEIKFVAGPLVYARPGSPIETAFRDKMPLFDADRPLPSLFNEVGVTELKPGETVVEHFEGATNFVPAKRLRQELQTEISPHLLAYVISESGSNASEQIINRLERFEIHAVRNLSVSFSLLDDSAITATVDYRHFYLQSELTARARGGRERRFTLYVKGTDSTSIADIDADEFGAMLATVFDDTASAEMQGTFARIVSRYQAEQGRANEMQEYLFSNLGISHEAQDSARAILAGEVVTAPAAPAPRPAQVHKSPTVESGTGEAESIKDQLLKHQTEIQRKATSLVTTLTTTPSKPTGKRITVNVSQGTSAITPEQKKRGLEGEEEIKRRLQLPGGWGGFTLIKDRRDDGCGYDFLCELSGQEVMLEVKTFVPGGRIFVSTTELRVAFTAGEDYYLVGVVYENISPNDWSTHLLQNPASKLLINGEFVIQADLKLHASDLFG
jgi:hypothetical protein